MQTAIAELESSNVLRRAARRRSRQRPRPAATPPPSPVPAVTRRRHKPRAASSPTICRCAANGTARRARATRQSVGGRTARPSQAWSPPRRSRARSTAAAAGTARRSDGRAARCSASSGAGRSSSALAPNRRLELGEGRSFSVSDRRRNGGDPPKAFHLRVGVLRDGDAVLERARRPCSTCIVGYPALLAAWARARAEARAPLRRSTPAGFDRHRGAQRGREPSGRGSTICWPSTTRATQLQIIVVSDGSTDDTAGHPRRAIAAASTPSCCRPAARRARSMPAWPRRRHDVLVFTDARQTFARDALRALVAPLADPRVSAASRASCCSTASPAAAIRTIGEGVGAYWRYEKWLRRHESLIGSTSARQAPSTRCGASSWQPLPSRDDPRRCARRRCRRCSRAPAWCSRDGARPTTAPRRSPPPSSGARRERSPATTSC